MQHSAELIIDGWRIELTARTATQADRTVQLSPRAIRLLTFLTEAGGATLSRSDLLDRVWPHVIVSDESLTQVVAELRRTLGNKRLIATVPRGGYRLTVPAKRRHLAAPSVGSEEAGRDKPSLTDLEAHALCLDARTEIVRCGPGALERAEELTGQAAALAPTSAHVHAERAVALVRSHLYWSDGRAFLERALSHAETAAALAPRSGAGQSSLGYVHATAGHWQAANVAHQRAIAMAPRNASCYNLAAWHLMIRRKTRAAVTFFENVGALETGNVKGYLHAALLARPFDPERARRNAGRALYRARDRLAGDPADLRALVATGLVMAVFGEHTSAFATLDRIDTSGSAQGIYMASALAMIGESDRAFLHIEELFDHGWRDMAWLAVDPAFATLTEDRRFTSFCRDLQAA